MAYTEEFDKATFLKNEAQEAARNTSYTRTEYFKPAIGSGPDNPARSVLRLLPRDEKMEEVFVKVNMHYFPTINQETGREEIGQGNRPIPIGVVCLREFGEDCPACDHVEKLFAKSRTTSDPKEAAALVQRGKDQRTKLRVYTQIIDMEHPEKGVQRWVFGADLLQKLRACFKDDNNEPRDITNSVTGRDIIVNAWKQPKTTFNDYSVKVKETPSALRDRTWLNAVTDLTEVRRKPSVDDVLNAIRGIRPQPQTTTTTAVTAPRLTIVTAPQPVAKPEAPKAEAPKAETKPKTKRQPVSKQPEPEPEPVSAEPYAVGRAACIAAGFTPEEITPDEVQAMEDRNECPNCWKKEADPLDGGCQTCCLLQACLTYRLAAAA
jgi:hypothetical protein